MQVMIIDDSATVRDMVRGILEEARFDVIEARDGLEGLAALETMKTGVVLCDVNMPRMDGLTMLETMQERGLEHPVVMLSSECAAEHIGRAKLAGAKGWLTKGVEPDEIVATVLRVYAQFIEVNA